MKLTNLLTDETVLRELGARLARQRIDCFYTQAQLARRAGIGKRTLERIEAGDSVQLVSLIRVLRELETLENLDAVIPEAGPRPLDYVKRQGKHRQRASTPRVKEEPESQWRWGDER
jgi:DNA-binding XRE family transcriptional regulator